MERLRVNKSGEFSSAELKAIISDIKKVADTSSEIIYVYSFMTIDQDKDAYPFQGRPKDKSDPTKTRGSSTSIHAKRLWAIRVEGSKEPLKTNFTTRETALRHAKQLQKKGLGRRIEVDNSLV